MRNAKPIRIASVRYNYIGTDDDFNRFLRNVVMDYLQEDVISPLEDDPTTQKEDSAYIWKATDSPLLPKS